MSKYISGVSVDRYTITAILKSVQIESKYTTDENSYEQVLSGKIEKTPGGEWVKWKDVKELIARKEQRDRMDQILIDEEFEQIPIEEQRRSIKSVSRIIK